uniref:Uncharacterized protein n=1 Tax=Streptomyces sp. NBC_00049 TaxID=2903617 RepID=A0AAU2JKR0_9ACTN
MNDLTTDRLADAWQHVRDTTPPAEADPLVLDCARRLAADPGGEQAPVWVAGLVAMSGYLAWRPGQEAGSSALDALRAAAKALGGRPCAHGHHPYETGTDGLGDEIGRGDRGLPAGGRAERDGGGEGHVDAGRALCPAHVAGWARLAIDVIAPFTVRGVPAGAPAEHHGHVGTLSGIVNDHPYCDPHEVLIEEAGSLPARPTRGALAGYLVTMNATCWYAASERVTERAVPEAMIKGVEAAAALLPDVPCTHGSDGHPDTDDPDHLTLVGYLLRTPGGRAELAEDHGWDEDDEDDEGGEPLDGWLCPAFLHGLAAETLEALTDGLKSFETA